MQQPVAEMESRLIGKTVVILCSFLAGLTVGTESEGGNKSFRIMTEKSDVTIGNEFALTCQIETGDIDNLYWSVRMNDREYRDKLLEGDGQTVADLTYNVSHSINDSYSVLYVHSEDDGKFQTRVDYTFYCSSDPFESDQQAEAKITIHPVDHSLRNGLIGAGAAALLLVFFLTALFLWRRRKLRAALALVSKILIILITIKTSIRDKIEIMWYSLALFFDLHSILRD